jgi:hypothetical protein
VRQNHQEFQVGFIWWAIGIGIFGGFMLGANKKFVFLTFLLGNISVIPRVLPTLIPHYLSGFGFIVTKFLLILFALSGFIGIISLIFLFLNLRSTFKG